MWRPVALLGWRPLMRRTELRLGFLSLAVVGAVVGGFAWLWANTRSHFGSVRHVSGQPNGSYLSHFSTCGTAFAVLLGGGDSEGTRMALRRAEKRSICRVCARHPPLTF